MALDEAGWFDRARHRDSRQRRQRGGAGASAAQRRYGRRSFRQLPEALRDKYFTRDADKDEWTVNPSCSAASRRWTRVNIVQPGESRALGRRDVIFCRNLFIYFTPASVREVAARFAQLDAVARLPRASARRNRCCGPERDSNCRSIGGAYVYVKP